VACFTSLHSFQEKAASCLTRLAEVEGGFIQMFYRGSLYIRDKNTWQAATLRACAVTDTTCRIFVQEELALMADRAAKFCSLDSEFDVLVIGGGATGLGIAVDATTRGLRTALVEAADFAQATSSRATKLVHGGVRYLVSGQMHLVYEALRERKLMMQNAPHLVHSLAFVTPAYRWFDLPFYGSGLKLYDLLAGSSSVGRTRILNADETRRLVPGIQAQNLKGSIVYYDGQFDDARMALALARTAEDHGAVVLNYAKFLQPVKRRDKIIGGFVRDVEAGKTYEVRAKVVINATGIFVDEIREQDDPASPQLLRVSRGTHIVLPPEVLGDESALMIPKTKDGRLIFAIPWLDKVVIGTTDVPAIGAKIEPGFEATEVDYLIETINPFLKRPIARADILSIFSGLRPLISEKAATTAKISREHRVDISSSGLITVAGGKWTTYRRMGEDTLDFAINKGMLARAKCITKELMLHGASTEAAEARPLSHYGTDAILLRSLMAADASLAAKLDDELPFTRAEVIFAVREEMARTVEDVLSRRTRALLLNARAAVRAAAATAQIMADELSRDQAWAQEQVRAFSELANRSYMLRSVTPV
jgi:glycerol-3-phosphate dehydrogenase